MKDCVPVVESMSEGHDDFVRSRCACGWTSRWEHWAFNGPVQPSYMLVLTHRWRSHKEST